MSQFEWFTVIAGGASVAGLPVALLLGWFATRLAASIHTAMQATLGDLGKAVTDGQRQHAETLVDLGKAFAESHRQHEETLAGINRGLQAMERAAEQRHEVLKALLERRP